VHNTFTYPPDYDSLAKIKGLLFLGAEYELSFKVSWEFGRSHFGAALGFAELLQGILVSILFPSIVN